MSTPPNLTNNWNTLRDYNTKLLDHYNTIIKPKLLEFYELTKEDITISLAEQTNKPEIRYKDGKYIGFYNYKHDTYATYSLTLYPNTDDNITEDHNITEDIRMVRLLDKLWPKILEYMNDRIDQTIKTYVQ